jgi:hypothetical protein
VLEVGFVAKNEVIKIGGKGIMVGKAGANFKWDSKTGIATINPDISDPTKEEVIPIHGDTVCEIPKNNTSLLEFTKEDETPLEDKPSGWKEDKINGDDYTLKYHYWYY